MINISIIRSAAICVGVIGLVSGCLCVSDVSDGSRAPFMRLMEADLYTYATDHDGWYPNADNTWSALAKLYPGYSAVRELAGLSGNIQQVTNALKRGLSLSNLTSWHYVPGFRIDDLPQLAILWELKPGLSEDGYSAPNGKRPVLLIGGDITNVSSADWESFLKQQEQLREVVQANRAAQTNALPKPTESNRRQ